MSHNKLPDFVAQILMRELRKNPKLKYKILPNGAIKFLRETTTTYTHNNTTLTMNAVKDNKLVSKAKSRSVGISTWESRTHVARLPRSLTR